MSNIVFDAVSRTFRRDGREQFAVDDVSLEVREREFVALVGPSGCGKTTCLRMAAAGSVPAVLGAARYNAMALLFCSPKCAASLNQ